MEKSKNFEPKVSVVIAAYNEEKYIGATIEAALALKYRYFEIIVVDNHSTDATAAIIMKYPAVKYILEKRQGVQFARAAGQEAATGDIVAFLDADCIPPPDWLTRCVARLANGAVAVAGPYYYYDNGRLFGIVSLFIQQVCYTLTNSFLQLLHIGGTMAFGNVVVTQEAILAIGGINTKIVFYGDDTNFAKQLTKVGSVIYDPRIIVGSSARRFKELGLMRTLRLYWWFFIREAILKSIFKEKTLASVDKRLGQRKQVTPTTSDTRTQ